VFKYLVRNFRCLVVYGTLDVELLCNLICV
jgi:hypothetical protein